MLKTLMNNANIWSEAQRTNVRWVVLAVACIVAVLWLAACGDGSAEEQPFVERQGTLKNNRQAAPRSNR